MIRSALFSLALTLGFACSAYSEVPIKERIALQNRKLGEVRTRRETVDRRLRSLSQQLTTLERQLDESRHSQAELERQIRRLKNEAGRARAEVQSAQAGLEEARYAHDNYEESFSLRLAHMYKRAALSPIGPLLESRSLSELVRRSRYVHYLREDAGRLHTLETSRDQVAERTNRLQDAEARATQLRSQLVSKERDLTRNILEQSRLVDQIRREREHENVRRGKLDDAQQLLIQKLKNLQRAAKVVASQRAASGAPRVTQLAPRKGQLRWPLDNEINILKPFGTTTNETGTKKLNSGIDLLVNQPSTVRSVAIGNVLYKGIFTPEFGKVVMIDHGGSPVRIIALYGNLDTILVGLTQKVQAGDPVGTVGESPNERGVASFHFEIRKGTEAQNPLHWLARR